MFGRHFTDPAIHLIQKHKCLILFVPALRNYNENLALVLSTCGDYMSLGGTGDYFGFGCHFFSTKKQKHSALSFSSDLEN